MAVAHIANHSERHVNPLAEQRLERQSGANTAAKENSGNKAVTEDTFTPSTQNSPAQTTAQDAGLFNLNQAAVAANTVLAQPTPGVSQIAVSSPAAAAATAATASAQTSATSAASEPANAAQQVGATPVAQAATAAVGTTTNVQDQIQSLNTALAALGLSNYDIEQIDRIATVIQNFSPTAYTDLVNQFQQLARQVSQPPAANANAPAPASTPANTTVVAGTNATANTNAGANANAPGGNFQVQGITINFTGVQEAANSSTVISGGQDAPAASTQTQTVNLQIEQVQFTLSNGNGQAVQVVAPQQAEASAGGNS